MKKGREQKRKTGKNILACLFAPFFAVIGAAVVPVNAEETLIEPIGLYVLLGEDAVGRAACDEISDLEKKEEYGQGFKNVYYYGNADENMSYRLEKPLELGHGMSVQNFGVEVGFAEELSNKQEKSLVFKYAVSGESFSECMKAENGFSKKLAEMLEKYRKADYEISLKGSVWLGSGEENAVEAIEELRATYKEAGIEENPIAPVLLGGIGCEDSAVLSQPFVYPLEYELPKTADETLLFGKRLAEELIEKREESSVRVCVGENGRSDVSYQTFREETTVTLTAKEGYFLSEVYINGEKVETPTDGKLQFQEGRYFVTAKFERKPTYSLNITSDIRQGVCIIENAKEEYYEGETVRFQIKTSKDYVVDSVSFNGDEIFEADGFYTVEIQAKENTIVVTYRKELLAIEPETEAKSGCRAGISGSIPILILGMSVLFKRKKG